MGGLERQCLSFEHAARKQIPRDTIRRAMVRTLIKFEIPSAACVFSRNSRGYSPPPPPSDLVPEILGSRDDLEDFF